MRLWLCCVVGVDALMPNRASAQPPVRSLPELQSLLEPGDEVRVIDASGATIQGRVIDLRAGGLNVAVDGRPRNFPEGTIRQVRKHRPDSRWNGVLIGAVLGAAVGAVTKARNCGATDCGEGGLVDPGFYVIGAAGGAGVGALVDGALKKFDVVFAAPSTVSGLSVTVAPLLSRHLRGVRLSIAF